MDSSKIDTSNGAAEIVNFVACVDWNFSAWLCMFVHGRCFGEKM